MGPAWETPVSDGRVEGAFSVVCEFPILWGKWGDYLAAASVAAQVNDGRVFHGHVEGARGRFLGDRFDKFEV